MSKAKMAFARNARRCYLLLFQRPFGVRNEEWDSNAHNEPPAHTPQATPLPIEISTWTLIVHIGRGGGDFSSFQNLIFDLVARDGYLSPFVRETCTCVLFVRLQGEKKRSECEGWECIHPPKRPTSRVFDPYASEGKQFSKRENIFSVLSFP